MPSSDPHDPREFVARAGAFTERLWDWLEACHAGRGPVLPVREPAALTRQWSAQIPRDPDPGAAQALLEAALESSNHLHHPGYVGHQVAAPLPTAALFELAGALLNNGMAVYEMGQLQTICERQVLSWMARELGLPASAGGLLTSGGSLGNLTALLAARQARTRSWESGMDGARPPALLVSADSHYCISRAVQVMGWGAEGIVRVPVDAAHRMRVELLPELRERALADGRSPIAVVASSCTTSTGAFDPLPPIAEFCEEHGLWMHVDGAHGAAHALSERHGHVLEGIERADSVVWDAHKLLQMPALSTAVLFREERYALESFAQEAGYLFEDEMAGYDVGHRTLECTKRAMGFTLYGSLLAHGTQAFRDHVDIVVDLAAAFADMIESAPDFELVVRPETNIVCFRYLPEGAGDLDGIQERIRREVVESGAYYLVQTRLPEGVFLRVTLMNARTSLEDLRGLLEALRGSA